MCRLCFLLVQHNTRCRIVNVYARITGEAADTDYQFIGYLVVGKGGFIFNHDPERVASAYAMIFRYTGTATRVRRVTHMHLITYKTPKNRQPQQGSGKRHNRYI